MNFSEYAKDHKVHPHCASCAGCLVDPQFSTEKNRYFPLWCVGCKNRIKSNLPEGAQPPWMVEFAK